MILKALHLQFCIILIDYDTQCIDGHTHYNYSIIRQVVFYIIQFCKLY